MKLRLESNNGFCEAMLLRPSAALSSVANGFLKLLFISYILEAVEKDRAVVSSPSNRAEDLA
jgi:hypothetical protein